MFETKMIVYLIFWFVIWFLLAYLFIKIIYIRKFKNIRKDAIKRSKSVILWNVKEKVAPLLPNFEYSLKDLVFLWKWIDYLIFDGLSEGELKQVVFLEIKTWKSQLNSNERKIRKIVNAKKIKYEIMHLD
jgi:predicted Holliday junction resolvase-like endonuclease